MGYLCLFSRYVSATAFDKGVIGIQIGSPGVAMRDIAGRLASQRASSMPTAIAATKVMADDEPKPSAVNAGPGQKPARPQPRPKMAGPETIRRSSSCWVG